MQRDSLGPDLPPDSSLARVAADLRGVAGGLVRGLRHIWSPASCARRPTAIGGHRFVYGVLLLMSILLYRNYFYPGSDSNEALRHFLPVVVSSAIGYGAAAWLTPVVTRRLSHASWITILLGLGGVVTITLGLTFGQVEFIAIGFALGLVAQGLAICVTTILQQEMQDAFRGRVFSVYDMLFNVTFVVGAAVSAAFMPISGRSVAMLLVVGCGYFAAAIAYRLMAGGRLAAGKLATIGPTSTGPTSAEPTSTGPTSPGPTSAGPTSTGPTSAGPTPAVQAPAEPAQDDPARRV